MGVPDRGAEESGRWWDAILSCKPRILPWRHVWWLYLGGTWVPLVLQVETCSLPSIPLSPHCGNYKPAKRWNILLFYPSTNIGHETCHMSMDWGLYIHTTPASTQTTIILILTRWDSCEGVLIGVTHDTHVKQTIWPLPVWIRKRVQTTGFTSECQQTMMSHKCAISMIILAA
jgi:hypothetical protein